MTKNPRRSTEPEFEQQRVKAIEAFRSSRFSEDLSLYADSFEDARQATATLLELSVDLAEIHRHALEVAMDKDLLEALRYLAAPPISADDLKTLADTNTLNPNRLAEEPWRAERIVDTVLLALDRNRLPWVLDNREPTESERESAVTATAALIASRRALTSRANTSKDDEESAIAAALIQAGYKKVPSRTIKSYSDAPGPGEFCPESLFGSRKADLVVTLADGRLMPIEAKVSNSSTNSIKRLNNDAQVKAQIWLAEFGHSQTIPTAVLAGVFKTKNLLTAQDAGLTIFWAHDLQELVDFVQA